MADDNDNLYGEGKIGRRLYVRSPDGRWIIPPYGAGVDRSLRSLNIWDGKKKKWWTPSWPYVSNNVSSLNVKVPSDRKWDNRSGENPNWNYGFDHEGYIKLFYMDSRTDENWRIVSLLASVPNANPNTQVRFFKNFGPRGAAYTDGETLYYSTAPPNSGVNPYVSVYDSSDGNFGGAESLFSDYFAIYQLPPSRPVLADLKYAMTRTAGMLDLAAIRLHLETEFPQSNFYVGQYADISTMITKRVFIAGQLNYGAGHYAEDNTYIYGVPEVENFFNEMEFSFYYNTNVPGIYVPAWPYEPRYPAQQSVGGRRFVYRKGLGGPTGMQDAGNGAPQRQRFGGGYFQINILEPGEDNIAFSSVASPPVGLGSMSAQHYTDPSRTQQAAGPYPWGASVYCYFRPSIIQIHYAVPGHDTPESTHEFDLNVD